MGNSLNILVRIIFLAMASLLILPLVNAQVRPNEFPEEINPNDGNFETYSQKGGINRRASLGNLKKYFTPFVVGTIAYVPTPFGNSNNRMEFVTDPNGDKWYIDSQGRATLLGKSYLAGAGISITGPTIANTGDLSNTNEIQRVDTLAVVGGALRVSLLNDGVPFSSVALPVPDGSETKVNGGAGASVTGLGTVASPYVVNATDASVTNEIQRVDTLAVVGGALRVSLLNDGVPFSSVALPVPDGSETKVNGGTGTSVTGLGTVASPYVVNATDASVTNELQTIDTLRVNGANLEVSLTMDNQPVRSVALSSIVAGGGGVTGSGIADRIPYWNTPTSMGNSPFRTNSTLVSLNSNLYTADFSVQRVVSNLNPIMLIGADYTNTSGTRSMGSSDNGKSYQPSLAVTKNFNMTPITGVPTISPYSEVAMFNVASVVGPSNQNHVANYTLGLLDGNITTTNPTISGLYATSTATNTAVSGGGVPNFVAIDAVANRGASSLAVGNLFAGRFTASAVNGQFAYAGYFTANGAGSIYGLWSNSGLNVLRESTVIGATTAPLARLHVVGPGSTSSTNTAQFNNSIGGNTLIIRDDGNLFINTTTQLNSARVNIRATTGLDATPAIQIMAASGGGTIRLNHNGTAVFSDALQFPYFGSPNGNCLTTSNVGIGSFSLTPLGRLHIIGSGSSSATNAFYVQNVVNTRLFSIDNAGQVAIGNNNATRTLDLNGEMRVRDLTTTTATALVGTDSDGVFSSVPFSTAVNSVALGGDLSGTVANAQIIAAAVGTAEISDGAITLQKMASASVNSATIVNGSVGALDLADQGATTGQVMQYAGAGIGWTPASAGGDVSGTYTNLQIGSGVVASAEIADNSVQAGDLFHSGATTWGSTIHSNGSAWVMGHNLREGYTTTSGAGGTGTITLSSTRADNIITGSNWTNLTVNMPNTPSDGQIAHVTFDVSATNINFSGNGSTLVGTLPSSVAVGDNFSFKYYSTTAKWYKLDR